MICALKHFVLHSVQSLRQFCKIIQNNDILIVDVELETYTKNIKNA